MECWFFFTRIFNEKQTDDKIWNIANWRGLFIQNFNMYDSKIELEQF